jgi:glycosyltransferase involved in cell wall biosynthesis
LIEAFARTLAAEPEWHLVICGPDQVKWQTQLQALAERRGIKDRITWTGMVQGALKWGALRAAEIFVLPSHQENFGIAVAEALACGTPVLISDKVNIWREVQGAQAGIVAADDLDGTCTLLRRWLAMSPAQRLQMRQCARRCFLGDFEINAASQTLIHSLSDIIEGKAMHAGA